MPWKGNVMLPEVPLTCNNGYKCNVAMKYTILWNADNEFSYFVTDKCKYLPAISSDDGLKRGKDVLAQLTSF